MPSERTQRACDVCGNEKAALLPCGDHWHYFCETCARIANPQGEHWQCEACGTFYGEYVNGCPKCSELGVCAKVVGTSKITTLFDLEA